ncbi:hypothetical protein QFC22_003305 [Naganishia vaughanmartiniae]|uniref:Uncharacterized protein n=1 Tax=Naganishia vaughanmartiniae TaxID=1424756 RepID=A0ACC2X851_9TREE|nr:hypothetical protein QFC22_003305 [Naganishia vaughanmartiniae]
MGFRSVDLHASALSPAEYAVYTPIVAKLLETHIGSKDSDVVARKDFQALLQEEWSIAESQLQGIFTRLPSYPSSQLPVGEIYATLRLLAHEQHTPKSAGKSHPAFGVSQDELVFIQCKPLAPQTDKQSAYIIGTSKKAGSSTDQKLERILAEPLQPPPRRQTSLKIPSSVKPPIHSSPVRHLDHHESSVAIGTDTSPHAGSNKRSTHVKSKSTGSSTTLPRSTPLLNPFRTAQPSGQTGFISPPPIPPKPSTKTSAVKQLDAQETTLLIAIEDGPAASVVDSNPFRRSLPAPGLPAGEQNMSTEQTTTVKPPLPPRLAPNNVKDFAPGIRSMPELATPPENTSSGSGNRSRAVKSETKRSTQPTSLLQPSRLIREGLMAAEQARNETHITENSGRPISVNPEYVSQTQRTWSGYKGSNYGDSDAEGSRFSRSKKVAAQAKPKTKKDRSGSLLSDTTDGIATSNSSMEDLTLNSKVRQSNTTLANIVNSRPSPFDDPIVRNGPWPPPPKRNATIPPLGARMPSSYDIITSSGDTDGETGDFGQGGNLSRRSTLKMAGSSAEEGNVNNRSSFPPSIGTENILAVMSDLGEDVRRAAQGVGNNLEWLRGGRGGRSLGMTVPAPDDHGGDGRRGLIADIGKNDTGSTAASSDL